MHWFHRSDIWVSLLLAMATIVTCIYIIETAYQTRQLYSSLQELRAERDRLTIEWGRLMLERGAVSADMRIDAMARSSLLLSSPESDNVMLMERPQ
jgi:cell division protein FtsL